MCKHGWKWLITLLVLILAILSACMAGAEGNKLETRFTIKPKPAEPMRGSSSGITITCTQGNINNGTTCTPYTFTWKHTSPYADFSVLIGVLDDPMHPNTADTLYSSGNPETSFKSLNYTFYQTGHYVLFVTAQYNNNVYTDYLNILILNDNTNNPLNTNVANIAQICKVEGNEFQTAVNINEHLTSLITYDNEQHYYSPEAALVQSVSGHKAVCNGYSRAYELIAKTCGLECVRVFGDSKGEGHAWNAVKING